MEGLKKTKGAENLIKALESKDESKIKEAYETLHNEIYEKVVEKFDGITKDTDRNILASRGIRTLTSKEKKFYESWISAAGSDNPQQALTELLKDGQPATIVEDVFNELKQEHPLLKKIKFKYVKYLTKWLVTGDNTKNYTWGQVTSQITAKIEADIKHIDIEQSKLSCYALLPLDMLELGPEFLDTYYRELLKETLAEGAEYAIAVGSGHDMPIGLNRDVHEGVDVNSTTGYPEKEAIKIKDFTPKSYGTVVSKLAKTEKGNPRKIKDLTMLCNPEDYLTKIMPATTTLVDGRYVNNVFPIPTDVIEVISVPKDKVILFLPGLYFAGLGTSKNKNIEYSDEFKFLEDVRTYKSKMFMGGTPKDNTVSVVLDISELEEFYTTVKVKETTPSV